MSIQYLKSHKGLVSTRIPRLLLFDPLAQSIITSICWSHHPASADEGRGQWFDIAGLHLWAAHAAPFCRSIPVGVVALLYVLDDSCTI